MSDQSDLPPAADIASSAPPDVGSELKVTEPNVAARLGITTERITETEKPDTRHDLHRWNDPSDRLAYTYHHLRWAKSLLESGTGSHDLEVDTPIYKGACLHLMAARHGLEILGKLDNQRSFASKTDDVTISNAQWPSHLPVWANDPIFDDRDFSTWTPPEKVEEDDMYASRKTADVAATQRRQPTSQKTGVSVADGSGSLGRAAIPIEEAESNDSFERSLEEKIKRLENTIAELSDKLARAGLTSGKGNDDMHSEEAVKAKASARDVVTEEALQMSPSKEL